MPRGEENFSYSHQVAWVGVGTPGCYTVVQNEPPSVCVFSLFLSRSLLLDRLDVIGGVGRYLF